jgi:hypothetical protein
MEGGERKLGRKRCVEDKHTQNHTHTHHSCSLLTRLIDAGDLVTMMVMVMMMMVMMMMMMMMMMVVIMMMIIMMI